MKFNAIHSKNIIIYLSFWIIFLNTFLINYTLSSNNQMKKVNENMRFNTEKEKKSFKSKHKIKTKNSKNFYYKQNNQKSKIF